MIEIIAEHLSARYNRDMKDRCPGSKEITSPSPDELVCVFCRFRNEIWSDEPDMICKGCGRTITRDMVPSCIEWCPSARECVGADKFDRILKKLKSQQGA